MRSRALALCTVVALAAPAASSSGRAGSLPTRVPGTRTIAVDIGTIGLAEGSVVNGAVRSAHGFEIDLASSADKKTIEGAFEFLREDCLVRILPPHSRISGAPVSSTRRRSTGLGTGSSRANAIAAAASCSPATSSSQRGQTARCRSNSFASSPPRASSANAAAWSWSTSQRT